MSLVDPLFAQWLQDVALRVTRVSGSIDTRWGAGAIVSERITGIATVAAAQAEADRQLAFLANGPFAIDVHQLLGDGWSEALGQIVTLTVDQLGYDDGLDVFVIEAEVDRTKGISVVAVLRRLEDGA